VVIIWIAASTRWRTSSSRFTVPSSGLLLDYCPGTALMFAPWLWFKLGNLILPVVVCGASGGLLVSDRDGTDRRRRRGDGPRGWLARLEIGFRTVSMYGDVARAMLLLACLYGLGLACAGGGTIGGVGRLALGAVSGWATITRPAVRSFSRPHRRCDGRLNYLEAARAQWLRAAGCSLLGACRSFHSNRVYLG